MSSKALHQLLYETYDKLEDTLKTDGQTAGSDPNSSARLISEYLDIYRAFEECYDQIIHTQQRTTLRKCLTSVVGRLLELFHNRSSFEQTFSSTCLQIMTQTQSVALKIPVPRIVKDDQGLQYIKREDLISKSKQQFDEARLAAEMSTPLPMELAEAVLIVQRTERARHSRHETLIKKGIRQQQETMHRQSKLSDKERSATIIKKFWYKYGSRNKEQRLKNLELELIGMKSTKISSASKDKVASTMNIRKEKQNQKKNELGATETVCSCIS